MNKYQLILIWLISAVLVILSYFIYDDIFDLYGHDLKLSVFVTTIILFSTSLIASFKKCKLDNPKQSLMSHWVRILFYFIVVFIIVGISVFVALTINDYQDKTRSAENEKILKEKAALINNYINNSIWISSNINASNGKLWTQYDNEHQGYYKLKEMSVTISNESDFDLNSIKYNLVIKHKNRKIYDIERTFYSYVDRKSTNTISVKFNGSYYGLIPSGYSWNYSISEVYVNNRFVKDKSIKEIKSLITKDSLEMTKLLTDEEYDAMTKKIFQSSAN